MASETLRVSLAQHGALSADLERARRGLASAESSLEALRAREAAARELHQIGRRFRVPGLFQPGVTFCVKKASSA